MCQSVVKNTEHVCGTTCFRERQWDVSVAGSVNLCSEQPITLSWFVPVRLSGGVCTLQGGVCFSWASEWVGVASRKPEGFGTCAWTRSIGVSLHSSYLTPPYFTFQFLCRGWFHFWTCNVCLYFTPFSVFFSVPFFHPRKKYREGRRSHAEKCASLSLACALSLAHSLFHSVIAISAEERLFFYRPHWLQGRA